MWLMDAEMTHRIQSGWKNWKWVSGVLCNRRISLTVKPQRETIQDGRKTSNDARCRDTDTAKKAHEKDNEGGRNIQEGAGKLVEVVWACIEKRRRICRQESDGDGGAGEKKERNTRAEVVG